MQLRAQHDVCFVGFFCRKAFLPIQKKKMMTFCCSDKSDEKTPGILVTVQTNESIDIKENLRKLAVIGIVRDELEEILEMFIPSKFYFYHYN